MKRIKEIVENVLQFLVKMINPTKYEKNMKTCCCFSVFELCPNLIND